MAETSEALMHIGAKDGLNPGRNGSYAFIGYTGPQEVSFLKQVVCQRQQGPAEIGEFIITPAAEAEVLAENVDELLSDYEPVAIDEYDFDQERLQSDYEHESFEAITKRSARVRLYFLVLFLLLLIVVYLSAFIEIFLCVL